MSSIFDSIIEKRFSAELGISKQNRLEIDTFLKTTIGYSSKSVLDIAHHYCLNCQYKKFKYFLYLSHLMSSKKLLYPNFSLTENRWNCYLKSSYLHGAYTEIIIGSG